MTSSGAPRSCRRLLAVEDPQRVDLARQRVRLLDAVVDLDADQHEQPGADLADDRPVDLDTGRTDPLNDRTHPCSLAGLRPCFAILSEGSSYGPPVRLLHTSDWHLGRSLHRADLREAQAEFLDALVGVARSERVDAVLVCGDVYDRAVPPLDAVQLCEDALVRLRDAGARVVVISGNHDSATRLGFSSALVDAAGVHLRTDPRGWGLPCCCPTRAARSGSTRCPTSSRSRLGCCCRLIRRCRRSRSAVGTPGFCGGPWIACAPIGRLAGLQRGRRHGPCLGRRGSGQRERARHLGRRRRSGRRGPVRRASDYVALGHLHAPQTLSETVRYSGSPLAYSFGEVGSAQGQLARRPRRRRPGVTSSRVPAPVPRELSSIRGRLEDLLHDPALSAVEDHYLSVVLTDAGRPADPMTRLRRRFPHVLVLEHAPEGALTVPGSYRTRLAGRDDLVGGPRFRDARAWHRSRAPKRTRCSPRPSTCSAGESREVA